MTVVYSDEFRKQFKKLPADIQTLYRKQEAFFRLNWNDPLLHTKKLSGHPLPYSFRITRAYRALFTFLDRDTVLMATIGHRKDIYR